MSQPKRQPLLSLNNTLNTSDGDRLEHLDLLASSENPWENCYLEEIRERIHAIINSTEWQAEHPRNRPEFNLAVFLDYKYQGLSYRAIAEKLGVSPEYAASHWQRKFQPALCELLRDFQRLYC
jgi:DNA-binding CsgD family transcriptional regulator